MISEADIKKVIEEVLSELVQSEKKGDQKTLVEDTNCEGDMARDISSIDLSQYVLVPNPHDMEGLKKLKASTPARIGVWRTGPRYLTETMLRFRADHAVAMDAVFTSVDEGLVEELGLLSLKTCCSDQDEFLTRPDLGKVFPDETMDMLKTECIQNPQLQIIVADGLSSTAIEANIRDILPVIMEGIKAEGIQAGTEIFVKHGRVGSMDAIGEAVNAEVTIILIGERPGLATAESMSCYMAYKTSKNKPESNRTVVSNIHKGGTPAVEAGAHIVTIIKKMLEKKASGVDLKL